MTVTTSVDEKDPIADFNLNYFKTFYIIASSLLLAVIKKCFICIFISDAAKSFAAEEKA